MGTEKRDRQKQGREARRLAIEAELRRSRRRRRALTLGLLAVVVLVGLVVLSAVGGDDDETDVVADDPTVEDDSGDAGDSDEDDPDPEGPDEGFAFGDGECPPADKPAEPVTEFDDAPENCLEEGVDYGAVITTSLGEFTVDLAEGEAPGTVNNFVVLARYGYYDGDDIHRVVPGFVIQGGDPVGEPPGTGGPGYTISDELPEALADYVEGALAMANSGPDTNGSQFFVCLDCSGLPGPTFSLFGQVTEGFEVVEAINALATGDGPPSQPVAITSVEITEA